MSSSWGVCLLSLVVLGTFGCGESKRDEPTDGQHEPDAGAPADTGTHPGQLLVLDAMHAPASALQALVNGVVVTTDDDGLATLPADLPAAYDVSVFSGPSDYTFVGLTTRSPAVVLTNQYVSAQPMGYVELKLLYPANLPNERLILFTVGASGPGVKNSSYSYNRDSTSAYASAYWVGPPSATISAEAFLVDYDRANEAVTGYEGYASMEWPEAGGSDITWTPEFGPVPFDMTTLEFDVTLPSGAVIDFDTVDVVEPGGRTGSITFGPGPKFIVPDQAGAVYEFDSLTSKGASAFVAEAHDVAPGEVVDVQAMEGPTQIAPAAGATGVSVDTEFTWSARDGAVYYLFAYTTDNGPYLDYQIATKVPSAKLPDLSLLGEPFPAGRTFEWQAHTEYGHASLETYAAGERSTGWGYSDSLKFTTAGP